MSDFYVIPTLLLPGSVTGSCPSPPLLQQLLLIMDSSPFFTKTSFSTISSLEGFFLYFVVFSLYLYSQQQIVSGNCQKSL
ncbi:hypothetical protein L1887_23551 [Cichorium endivia]|nr:hypothetical protein L1887_23551 [Cichorium endivia]